MDALRSIWEGFDFTYLLNILLGVIPSLICITLHELSHGFVAYRLGDDTAKRAGRLTLNPLKHLDPMGLLMMLVFHFGWAKPVPVNMMGCDSTGRARMQFPDHGCFSFPVRCPSKATFRQQCRENGTGAVGTDGLYQPWILYF